MTQAESIVLRTLLYADVFDYPMTQGEIQKFAISISKPKSISVSKIPKSKYFPKVESYFCIKGREDIISKRKKNQVHAQEKTRIAKRLSSAFKIIPTVRLVAVTGAVAAGNADEKDDIDLLIVSSSGWIWTTRFLVVFLASMLGIRRKPNDLDIKDKLCLNMFIDESHLKVPKKEQDVFSANEIVRMKILWGRKDTESRFYSENKWVERYLSNIQYTTLNHQSSFNDQYLEHHIVESLLKKFQLQFMKSKRTNEVIREGYLRFHPNDARKWILKKYKVNLEKYGLKMV